MRKFTNSEGWLKIRKWLEDKLAIFRNGGNAKEFEPEQEFRRRLKAVDERGKKTGVYDIAVDYNWLTTQRIWFELETFQNFAIATGGDAIASFNRELTETKLIANAVSKQIAAAKSPYEIKHLQARQDALTEYVSVIQKSLESLERFRAETRQPKL